MTRRDYLIGYSEQLVYFHSVEIVSTSDTGVRHLNRSNNNGMACRFTRTSTRRLQIQYCFG